MRGQPWLAGLQERIIHEQLAAGKDGWRGKHGYFMPAPADRLVRPSFPDMLLRLQLLQYRASVPVGVFLCYQCTLYLKLY